MTLQLVENPRKYFADCLAGNSAVDSEEALDQRIKLFLDVYRKYQSAIFKRLFFGTIISICLVAGFVFISKIYEQVIISFLMLLVLYVFIIWCGSIYFVARYGDLGPGLPLVVPRFLRDRLVSRFKNFYVNNRDIFKNIINQSVVVKIDGKQVNSDFFLSSFSIFVLIDGFLLKGRAEIPGFRQGGFSIEIYERVADGDVPPIAGSEVEDGSAAIPLENVPPVSAGEPKFWLWLIGYDDSGEWASRTARLSRFVVEDQILAIERILFKTWQLSYEMQKNDDFKISTLSNNVIEYFKKYAVHDYNLVLNNKGGRGKNFRLADVLYAKDSYAYGRDVAEELVARSQKLD